MQKVDLTICRVSFKSMVPSKIRKQLKYKKNEKHLKLHCWKTNLCLQYFQPQLRFPILKNNELHLSEHVVGFYGTFNEFLLQRPTLRPEKNTSFEDVCLIDTSRRKHPQKSCVSVSWRLLLGHLCKFGAESSSGLWGHEIRCWLRKVGDSLLLLLYYDRKSHPGSEHAAFHFTFYILQVNYLNVF